MQRETRPGWLAAERSGASSVGPGAGWDPLAARELDDALRLGDLAARMTRVAVRLATAVRRRDQEAIARIIGSLVPYPLPEDVQALLVVQAGMIAGAGAATSDDLLGWVDFDEHGWPLPAAAPEPAGPAAAVIPTAAEQAAHRADLERALREHAEERRRAA